MKVRDYIFLAFKNLVRRKKGIVSSVILIVISVIISTLVLSFSLSVGNYMNRALINNVSYRTIVIIGVPQDKQEEVIESLKKIEHISNAVKESEERTMTLIHVNNVQNLGKDFTIGFNGVDITTQPEVILGRKIKEGEKNVCIIPNKIYPPKRIIDTSFDKEAYISGEDLLGKMIEVSYNSYDESSGDRVINKTFQDEYEIVGVYDVDEYPLLESWYVPFDNIININNNVEENTILNPNVTYGEYSEQISAYVDSALNLDSTIEKVEELGYRCIIRSTANTYIVIIINVVVGIVLTVLLFIVLTIITSSSIKSLDDRKYEIGMLKAIGYKNKYIRNMLLCENLVISIGAYLLGIIISIIAMSVIKINILDKSEDFSQLNCNLNVWVCFIALLFAIIVPTISTYLGGKGIFKRTPISLNKER